MERQDLVQTLHWLGIAEEDAGVLLLFPLARVAWADDQADDRERDAIRKLAAERGFTGEEARRLLEGWLAHKPSAEYSQRAMAALVGLAQHRFGLGRHVDAAGLQATLAGLEEVAKASGGVLGLFSISAAERELIDGLRGELDPQKVGVDSIQDPWAPPPSARQAEAGEDDEDDDDEDDEDDDEGDGAVQISTGLRLGVKKVRASDVKKS